MTVPTYKISKKKIPNVDLYFQMSFYKLKKNCDEKTVYLRQQLKPLWAPSTYHSQRNEHLLNEKKLENAIDKVTTKLYQFYTKFRMNTRVPLTKRQK